VADGVWSFLGPGPEDFKRERVSDVRGVFGSGAIVDGRLFKGGPQKDVVYWMGLRGPMLGLSGGEVLELGRGKAEPAQFLWGTSGVIENKGQASVVTALDKREGPGDSVRFEDTFTANVITRGITDA
jgi:hypothetical protein